MSEWTAVRLSEIADIRVSNVDKKSVPGEPGVRLCNYMDVYANDYITADLPFMEATAPSAQIERFKVEVGDVMITKDSESPDDIGIPAVAVDSVDLLVCGYHLALIKPRRAVLDGSYLAKQLGTGGTARYFGQRASGSTRYGLSTSAIANTPIPLAPLPQQRRIAEILTTVDEAMEQTEALVAKLQQMKAGLMHDLFTRGVTPEGHLRPTQPEAPHLYHQTPLGWLPREWEIVTTEDCASKVPGSTTIGPFGSDLLSSDYCTEGVPVAFVRDVKESGFEWNSNVYVSPTKAERLRAHSVKSGDLLSTKMGLPPCVTCSYPDWMENGVITADIVRLRPDSEKINGRWLAAAMNGESIKRQVQAITAGVTRPKVTLSDYRRLRLSRPLINEQNLIAERLASATCVLDIEAEKLAKLRQQKQGLMQDLLTGRVPVFTK